MVVVVGRFVFPIEDVVVVVVVVTGRFVFPLWDVVVVLMPSDRFFFVVAFDVASGVDASVAVEENAFGFAFGFFFPLRNKGSDLIV